MEIDAAALAAALIENTRRVESTRRSNNRDDASGALTAITATVVEMDIADCAGITERIGQDEFASAACTVPLVSALDILQYELDEGPCVQAVYEQGLLVSRDVRTDPRWPRWGPQAADLGVVGVISVHLYTSESALGALNLYSLRPRNYGSDDLDVARLAGGHASMALAHYRRDVNLWKAIEARHRVGQAQGILMERYQIDTAQSFAVLRRLSQQHNRKLHLIADQIVTTRRLPDAADIAGGRSEPRAEPDPAVGAVGS